jgi:hypothetical protein
MRTISIIILLIAILSIYAFAYYDDTVNIRAFALGGAFAGITGDISSPLFNPAGLGLLPRDTLIATLTRDYIGLDDGGLGYGYFSYGHPFEKIGTVSLGTTLFLNHIMKESIMYATYSIPFIAPGKISLGVNFKYIIRNYRENDYTRNDPLFENGFSTSTYGVDVGCIIKPIENIAIGFSAKNLNNPDISLSDDEESKLPREFVFGSAFKFGRFMPLFDLQYINETINDKPHLRYHIGLEVLMWDERMNFRGGWNDNKLTAGFGLDLLTGDTMGLSLDYALGFDVGGDRVLSNYGSHKVGLELTFGSEVTRFKPKKDMFLFSFEDPILEQVILKTRKPIYEDEGEMKGSGRLAFVSGSVSELEEREIEYGNVEFEIEVKEDDVANLHILCKVDRDWIESENIDRESLTFRMVDDEGRSVDLSTKEAYIDEEYYHIELETGVIDRLAIVGMQKVIEEEPIIEEEIVEEEREQIHIVVPGECLFVIASYRQYYGDPSKWRRIYEANKDLIKDPHWIYPGQELVIPTEE